MNLIILFVILATITIGIATFLVSENIASHEELDPITLAINPFPGTDFAFIAQEKGFFEQNNVDVVLEFRSTYFETVNLFTEGKVDGVFEVYADALVQNANGIDGVVVYVMDYSTNGDVLIGNVDSINELKGKTLGANGIQSFSHYFVVSLLEKHGITENDVLFEIVDETEVLTKLNSKEISAGHTWGSTKIKSLKQNYTVLGNAGEIPGIILDVLIFKPEIVEQRPDDIKAIIQSLLQARAFLDSNRDESLKIMAEIEGLSFEEMAVTVDDAYRPNLSENIVMLTNTEKQSVIGLGQSILEFYSDRGAINKIPDLDKIIDSTFVNDLMS